MWIPEIRIVMEITWCLYLSNQRKHCFAQALLSDLHPFITWCVVAAMQGRGAVSHLLQLEIPGSLHPLIPVTRSAPFYEMYLSPMFLTVRYTHLCHSAEEGVGSEVFYMREACSLNMNPCWWILMLFPPVSEKSCVSESTISQRYKQQYLWM